MTNHSSLDFFQKRDHPAHAVVVNGSVSDRDSSTESRWGGDQLDGMLRIEIWRCGVVVGSGTTSKKKFAVHRRECIVLLQCSPYARLHHPRVPFVLSVAKKLERGLVVPARKKASCQNLKTPSPNFVGSALELATTTSIGTHNSDLYRSFHCRAWCVCSYGWSQRGRNVVGLTRRVRSRKVFAISVKSVICTTHRCY